MKGTHELDLLVLVMVALTFAHASTRPLGLGVAVTVFLLALAIEQASIWVGGTHCHADAAVMISPCSSLNSVAYYVRQFLPRGMMFSLLCACARSRCPLHVFILHSLNSPQVPWLYSCIASGQRLGLSRVATPFAVAIMMHGFIVGYEFVGPTHAWWAWPDDEGVVAMGTHLAAWEVNKRAHTRTHAHADAVCLSVLIARART